ncbi:hypothetical protein ACGFYY_25325 [Streptomyces sp. NPDC048331]|uniref:hypothetical protein n=1 Tax=Streptomyces sp. NPDC048331 TaxID=3365534 RepID=UPI0037106A6F
MALIARFPVFLRIGDTPEAWIGALDFPLSSTGRVAVDRSTIADMLRAAADAMEHPALAEEVPDAAPR